MLRRIFLFLFCACISALHAENSDYIDYFRKANQAELCIAKSDYRAALLIYKDIFKRFPHSLEKEVYNACLCALKENQWKDASNFAKELVLHGYELKNFESPAFNEFRNNKRYRKNFLSVYPKMRKQYEKNIHPELRDKYFALFETDQKYAHNVGQRIQDSVFYELALTVSGLIKEYGFPQWMINKDTINTCLFGMLRHFCGLENRIKASEDMQKDSFYIRMQGNDIRLLVTQALHEGLVEPERYVSIVSYWDNSNPYGDTAIGLDYENEKVTFFLRTSPDKREEMNQRRDSIGLPLLNELTQDAINSTWYGEYPFKKIKEAWLACDTCSGINYIKIAGELESEIRNKYKDEDNYFRYYSKKLSTNIHPLNSDKYQKNRKRRNDTDSR